MICFPLFAYPFPAAEAGVCEQGVCRQAELLVIVDLLLLVIVSGVCGERALAGSFQIGARADAAFFLKGFAEGMNKIIGGAGRNMGATNIETMKKFDISAVNEIMERIYKNAIV